MYESMTASFYQFYLFFSLMFVTVLKLRQQSAASLANATTINVDDIDEATLLKEWDFDKFFPSSKYNKPTQPVAESTPVKETKKKGLTHRRMDSDSKINNPFFRGFRRENSDFFPLSSRHSAVFESKNNRSSGFFNNRRGSEAGLNKKSNGEPVLMDYIKKTESPKNSSNIVNKDYGIINNLLRVDGNFVKPRREKTESDIVLRNSDARRSLRESLEARRREVETQFAKEVENMKKRNSRPIEICSVSLTSATNSVDGEEYLYIQVILTIITL